MKISRESYQKSPKYRLMETATGFDWEMAGVSGTKYQGDGVAVSVGALNAAGVFSRKAQLGLMASL